MKIVNAAGILPAALLGLAIALLGGCEQTRPSSSTQGSVVDQAPPPVTYELRAGDQITVELQSIPDPIVQRLQINEQGFISLRYIGALMAGGFTPFELQIAIRDEYLTQGIYNDVDVNVTVEERYVIVGGQVNRSGRVPWRQGMTINEAIQAAGGYNYFANRRDITLTRNGIQYTIDGVEAARNPELNYEVAPGDEIQVDRSTL